MNYSYVLEKESVRLYLAIIAFLSLNENGMKTNKQTNEKVSQNNDKKIEQFLLWFAANHMIVAGDRLLFVFLFSSPVPLLIFFVVPRCCRLFTTFYSVG